MSGKKFVECVKLHYGNVWGSGTSEVLPVSGFSVLPAEFEVLAFAPVAGRDMWVYATCGMSVGMSSAIELHMFSEDEEPGVPEILTAVANYHREVGGLGLGDTVNFGRPWVTGSLCSHGLISLPYVYGPRLEVLDSKAVGRVACYWLIPVSAEEVAFKKKNGLEALERAFDDSKLNYLEPLRRSVGAIGSTVS